MSTPTLAVYSTSSDEEAMLMTEAPPSNFRRAATWTGAAVLLGCAAVAGAGQLLSAGGVQAAPPLTAHSILQDDHFVHVVTENMIQNFDMSSMKDMPDMSGGMDAVKEKMRANMAKMQKDMEGKLKGEELMKLKNITLTKGDKAKAIAKLKAAYGKKSAEMSKKMADAMAVLEKEGKKKTGRRLAEVLSPHLADMQSIYQEMHPGQHFTTTGAGNFNLEAVLDTSAATNRRLAADTVEAGVKAHVHSLYRGLEEEFGDAMPKAPARMLESSGEQSFIGCLQKALPSPTDVCSCLADNMQEAMSMVMDMMKGKTL